MLGAAFYEMAVIDMGWGLILCGNLECYIFNTYLVFFIHHDLAHRWGIL